MPSLFRNPYSWSKLGSVLMFDWPPPVGFSYCSDPAGNGTSCGDWDDTRMAAVRYRRPRRTRTYPPTPTRSRGSLAGPTPKPTATRCATPTPTPTVGR